MDRMLYLAMSGAKQTMQAQAVATNNLANATTTGFKEDLSAFRSMQVFGPGHPSRVYAMEERPGINFDSGSLEQTGNDLDFAINGDGWIAVQAPDGSEAYTRRGDLKINASGLLENGAGLLVMGNSGPVALPPSQKIEFGVDGTVSIIPLGQEASTLAQIDRIKLVNPPLNEMEKGEDGLFRQKNGEAAEADAAVKIVSGALESSNVNIVGAMVEMITLSRQFEMQVKAMKTIEETDSASNEIMRAS